MDMPGISFEEFHQCMQELEMINQLTLAYRPTLSWMRPWLQGGETLRILDAGSGNGDMLRQIAKLAHQQQAAHSVSLTGVDLNPWAKRSAELSNSPFPVRHETADIFSFPADRPIDIIICSLFTHHLDDSQLVAFLRWIDNKAQRGWFINDLHRHLVPYYFIKFASALFSRNRLIRHDAPVSVARSFVSADWYALLDQAGLSGRVKLSWHFPFRICLSCRKRN